MNAQMLTRPNWKTVRPTGRRIASAAPSAAPGRRPEHVRVGQRVADDALERRPGDGEAGSDEGGRQDPRHPQLPDDRLGRGRPVAAEVEPETCAGG